MNNFLRKTLKLVKDNAPAILTGCTVSGVITTSVLTVVSTLNCLDSINEKKEEVNRKLTKKEVVQACWKPALPPVISAGLTIACCVASNHISGQRAAVLSSLYSLSQNALEEYKAKVIEKIGEKKEEKIRDEIAGEHVDHWPPKEWEIIPTGHGSTLCYDTLTGRAFLSSVEAIRSTQNDINKQVLEDGYATLNDYYYNLGLPEVELGQDLCWDLDHKLDVHFTAKISENEQEPYIVLSYASLPGFNYPF